MLGRSLSVFLALALAAPAARADDAPGRVDYFERKAAGSSILVRRPGSRTLQQKLVIAGLFGGAAIAAGAGVWFHLDSRDAADQVSADGDRAVGTWTDAEQDVYDRAHSSGVGAIVGYSLGAALLAGAIDEVVMTAPAEQELLLRPVAGGAIVGKGWTF